MSAKETKNLIGNSNRKTKSFQIQTRWDKLWSLLAIDQTGIALRLTAHRRMNRTRAAMAVVCPIVVTQGVTVAPAPARMAVVKTLRTTIDSKTFKKVTITDLLLKGHRTAGDQALFSAVHVPSITRQASV